MCFHFAMLFMVIAVITFTALADIPEIGIVLVLFVILIWIIFHKIFPNSDETSQE